MVQPANRRFVTEGALDDPDSPARASLNSTYRALPLPATIPAAQGEGLTRRFQPESSSYNVSPASLGRARARAARSIGGLARFDICVIGTSISAGTGAAGGKGNSWPAQFGRALQREGHGLSSGFIAGQSNLSGGTTDSRVTLTSGWTAFAASSTNLVQAATPSNPATFADTLPSTQVEIWYIDFFTISWTYSIDGGAPVTVTNVNSGTRKKITVSGLSSANHTVVITPTTGVTGSNPLYIVGVTFTTGTGVAVHNMGVGGAKAISGVLNTGLTYSPISMAVAHAPALTIIELGTNEVSPLGATFETSLQTAINSLIAAGSDVVILGEPPTGAGTRPLPAVYEAIYRLAESNNLALVDMSDRLVSWTSLSALGLGYTADGLTVHLNDAGSADIARTVTNALRL